MALKALMEWLFLRKGGLMWLQCVPGESFCRSRPCELYSCPKNTFICIWEINWVAFAMALIVGLTCRDMRPSSIDDTHPPFLKFLFICHWSAYMHRLSAWANIHQLYNARTYSQKRKEGRTVERVWGRGSSGDITSPACTTAVMCGAGQRKDGGWDKGRAGWRCRGGFEETQAW